MTRFVTAGVIAFLCVFSLTIYGALAHSWYPTRCCSDRDCKPVNAEDVEDRGDSYFFKKLNVSFPKDKAEVGKDEDFHICILSVESGLTVLCVFKPYSGS